MANPNWIKIAGSGQGALPANPNNPTITIVTAQDITNNKSGTGSIAKRVTVTVVPPNPVGTYSGVWIWLDHPDHSINPGTVAIDATDGTVPADGHTAAVGTFQPDQIGFFPYDPNNQQIVFDIDAPHVPELWRVYACPGSANSVQRPIEANKAGASPSYQFLANPPAPMASGVEYAPSITGKRSVTHLSPAASSRS